MSFLHGVETIPVEVAGRSYNIVKSGVIGILGIAPRGTRNVPILVTNENDFAQFGDQLPGFSIPQTLAVMAKQGAATAIVINVFDAAAHTTAVVAEPQTVLLGELKLAFAPVGDVTVLDSAGLATVFVEGTDYVIDAYGNLTVLSSAIANGTVLKFTYAKLNIAAITASVLIGTINGGTDVRTGSKCFELAYNQFGFNPKIFIAPGFSTLAGVASELAVLAAKYRGIAYQDAPAGTVVSGAIAGRGPAGTINFNTSNTRVELLFPQLKKYDPATDSVVNFPYSAFAAGVRQKVDNEEGFWVSSSNKLINCEGVEIAIAAALNDPNSETNLLNGAGITTIFNTFGTGIKTWGNRNASYPANTGPKTFSNVVRTDDIVSESMELASLPYVDQPITQGLIDVIREEGNAFIRTLIKRGALLPGSKVVYNPADNSAEELANGHIVFERVYMVATPAERITFKSVLDINLLNLLK